jgi:thioredoxin reductase
MSQYLVDRIEREPNIDVMTQTELVAVHGRGALDAVSLRDRRDGATQQVGATASCTTC